MIQQYFFQLCSAAEAVEKMLDRLLDPAHSKVRSVEKGEDMAVMINNLGGMSQLEELILANETVKQLS